MSESIDIAYNHSKLQEATYANIDIYHLHSVHGPGPLILLSTSSDICFSQRAIIREPKYYITGVLSIIGNQYGPLTE